MTKILIADDHPLYREALRAQIERLIPDAAVDEVTTFDEAIGLGGASDSGYDLYLIDFRMPGMSITSMQRFVNSVPKGIIAVISGSANAEDVRAVIQAGAKGFISKTATGAQLIHSLQVLLAGGTSVPANLLLAADASLAEGRSSDGISDAPVWLNTLTRRELDVLKAVARGLSNKEVGRDLGLAEVTVKLHLRSVFRKIDARNRSEAAIIATRANLV